MPLDPSYLEYRHRSYGMDHDRYDWSMLVDRPPVEWPDGCRLALWVNVGLQYFPLNQEGKPFPPPGGLTTTYPDLRHYTLREYGNRVGIFRFLDAFDRYNIRATFAVNARLAERYPYLINRLTERGDELICHGWHMDTPHYGGMDSTSEAEIIRKSLGVLRSATGQPIEGWISPGRSQSENTPDILFDNGVKYIGDWVNDELPYRFRARGGELIAMPLPTELEDRFVLMHNLHSEAEYADQIKDAFDYLYAESESQGGRMLALAIHPWMLGQPHRIGKLEEILSHITSHEGVWSAPAGDIARAWRAGQA